MKENILYAIVIIAIIILVGVNIYSVKKENELKPNISQVQKFRFGEQCPDGLRVEYVSTIRLPKSIVCQKAVGE